MNDSNKIHTGGCLCGQLRYEAKGAPRFMGHCYCGDCRKASGSGFVPFMSFPASAVRFSGQASRFTSKSIRGSDADRNFCALCGGLVFGGIVGQTDSYTIYAGSLDDPSAFHPTIAIFNRGRPDWAAIPPPLTIYEQMP